MTKGAYIVSHFWGRVHRNLSGIARPPHYTDGRFFAIYFCKAVPGNASGIAQTPVFIGL